MLVLRRPADFAFRHQEGIVLTYLDGHVKWRAKSEVLGDPAKTPAKSKASKPAAANRPRPPAPGPPGG